jgi:hypothetical protein
VEGNGCRLIGQTWEDLESPTTKMIYLIKCQSRRGGFGSARKDPSCVEQRHLGFRQVTYEDLILGCKD